MRAVLEESGLCVDVDAATTAELLRRNDLGPDCVVVDHELPGGALLAIRRLRAMASAPPVVLIGPRYDDEAMSLAAVRAGASAVVARNADVEAVAKAITTVMRGGVSLPPALVTAVVRDYQAGRRTTSVAPGASFPFRLSDRERRVLELLAEGMTTSEVAQALFVTTATVRSHVAGIVRGVGVRDREAAVQRYASWSRQAAAVHRQDAVSGG